MNNYEVLYIINDTIEEAAKKAIIERFANLISSNGGQVLDINEKDWGHRRLAYPIRFMNEGYYVLMSFKAEPEFIAELERNFRIASENVLRFMVTSATECAEAPKAEEAPAAEAPVEE